MAYDEQLWNLLESDPAAAAAAKALAAAGGNVFIVGGAVRDVVLGRNPKDIDLMVSGLDERQIVAALETQGKLDFTGKQFGVYRLRKGDSEVEVALPRSERSTGPLHTDFEITADPYLNPEEDLGRRDFTGNAMAFDLQNGTILDPHNGQKDLEEGKLRMVNENAFRDDPLRIVRALVANARFGLQPEPEVIEAMQEHAASIRHLPGERIQMEMDKLLSGPNPGSAMRIAFETGLIDYLAPELSSTVGFDQKNPHHDLTVDQHTLAVLDKMATISNDPDMRLAALFHDSGKPDSFWEDEGHGHFYQKNNDDGTTVGKDHEAVGAELVTAFMNRLRYPNKRIERVTKLVSLHMWPYFNSEKGARKFLAQAGDPKTAFDLLTIREADSSGKKSGAQDERDIAAIAQARELLQNVIEAEDAFTLKDLAIGGKDIIDLGVKPGPQIGQILEALLNAVIEDPSLNNKFTLTQLTEQLLGKAVKKSAEEELEVENPWLGEPMMKWSFDGELTIWPTDGKGLPNHIDLFPRFWENAQGRLYFDDDGSIQNYVWKERGTPELQDAAVDAVDKWLVAKWGIEAHAHYDIKEGIEWTQLGGDPRPSQINQYYYGMPAKKKPKNKKPRWEWEDDLLV